MSIWKWLVAVAALVWGGIYLRPVPETPPDIVAASYQPTLAERNSGWSQLCREIAFGDLPMGFFTVDLNHGPFEEGLDQAPRLFIPLDDNGVLFQSGRGTPMTAAQFDPEGRTLRQYFAGS